MTDFTLQEGINPPCSNDEYHGDREYLSSSAFKLIVKDPKQFYDTYILNKEPENQNKSAFALGSYIHTMILEPHLLEEEYAIFDGKVRRGKEWEAFQKENEGKTIITTSQKSLCDSLYKSYEDTIVKIGKRDVPVSSFFKKGSPEETICTTIKGVKVKARMDYRRCDDKYHSTIDVKSTGDIISTREQAEEVCEKWDYDLSAAFYTDIITKVTGIEHEWFFCFLSKKNGEVKMYKASEAMLERGRKKYLAGIDRVIEARESGIWVENKVEELR